MLETLKQMGPARLGAMGAVAAMLIGFFAVVIARVSQPTMATLFADLSFDDTTAITRELESLNVPFELRRDGEIILVPDDQVLSTRMRLAEQGLPTGGSMGYEIFDEADTLGSTSFVQNVNRVRALEGELARTIRSLQRVNGARVHLVLPERQLFQREQRKPSASIIVKTRGELDKGQVRAIQHLVASAIEGLDPGSISVVDEGGRLLASGDNSDALGMVASTLEERRISLETRLRNQVNEIVSSVVGPGRARVQVAAELDFNRITQQRDDFDPERQVVRSTQTREETRSASEEDTNEGVTAGNQIPEADAQAAPGIRSTEQGETTEEVVNYEIAKTVTTQITEAGRLSRLSVAVLVDGVYEQDGNGNLTYNPRTQEQLEQIAALVRSSIGFDAERGDTVEVVNLQFAEAPTPTDLGEEGWFNFTRTEIIQMIEMAVMALISLLVLLFVVRPLLKQILGPEKPPVYLDANGNEIPVNAEGQPLIEGKPEYDENGNIILENLPAPDWLKNAERLGAQHAASLARVGEIIEKNPKESVAIVRGWLNSEAA